MEDIKTLKKLALESPNELLKLLAEEREKLRQKRFEAHQRQLKNVREIRALKKSIARLLTISNGAKKDKKTI